jgi:hypothetical protein
MNDNPQVFDKNTHGQCLPLALFRAGIIDEPTLEIWYKSIIYSKKERNVEECAKYNIKEMNMYRGYVSDKHDFLIELGTIFSEMLEPMQAFVFYFILGVERKVGHATIVFKNTNHQIRFLNEPYDAMEKSISWAGAIRGIVDQLDRFPKESQLIDVGAFLIQSKFPWKQSYTVRLNKFQI